MKRSPAPLLLFSLVAASFVGAPFGAAQEAKPKPTSEAAVVGDQGITSLDHVGYDFEDGAHVVYFGDRARKGSRWWRTIEPGETRLVVMSRKGAEVASHGLPNLVADDFLKMWSRKAKRRTPVVAILYTNTSQKTTELDEDVWDLVKAGQALATGGVLNLRSQPVKGQTYEADFAFTFEARQVAGRVRIQRLAK